MGEGVDALLGHAATSGIPVRYLGRPSAVQLVVRPPGDQRALLRPTAQAISRSSARRRMRGRPQQPRSLSS